MTIGHVRHAYSARAAEYNDLLGTIEQAAEVDRVYIRAWAREITGPIVDVGCGPGQWTNYLHHDGADIEGIDPVEVFIEDAKRRYPSAPYRVGRAEDLGVPDQSLGGILAWFSLIHTEPDSIGAPLAEFGRCLKPGGSLLIGFVDGEAREPFDHAVTTAYYWSLDALTECLEHAGFTVTDSEVRADPNARTQGRITARRSAAPAGRSDRWTQAQSVG